MTHSVRNILLVTVAMTAGGSSAAAAQGLYWESTTTGVGTRPRATQIYAVPKMMKIVESDGATIIVRSDQDKVVTLDAEKQTYTEMDLTQLEGMAHAAQGQMDAVRAQMAEQLKNMPPEQRAMLEKMMPGVAAPPAAKPASVTVKNTGETKSISGYTCRKYVATQGDTTVLVAWTTTEVKGFEALRDDWLKFQKRMAAMTRMAGGVGDAFAQIDGFPMETEVNQIKTTVTKVEPRAIAAGDFQVPPGYKAEQLAVPH